MRKELSSLSYSAVFFLLAFIPLSSHAGKKSERTSLEHVLQQVYESNPSLMAARAELKETQEQMPQARAGYLPTVSAEASIYSSNVESSNFGSGDGATTKELSLNAEQPLWRGGKTTADIARAREVINAGESVLIKSEQDMFLRTIIVYMNVMRDRELVDLRKQNEAIMTQEFQAAQDRKAIGDVTDTSVQQAKARLARAESERIDAESSLDISIAEFEEIVGMTPQNSLEFPNTSFSFPQGLGEMKAAAEKQNPEIKIAEYETQAAEHNTDSVFSELLPRISAFASLNKQYDPQPGIVDETRTDTIGVRATMTLYEGGATRSRVREARHQAIKSRHRVDEAKRRVQQQVISNWRSYIAAQAEKKTRMVEIDATEEALKGLREESRMGQRTILDILDADQDVIDAKVALAHARRNEIVAKYSLASALGILTSDAFGLTFDNATTQ